MSKSVYVGVFHDLELLRYVLHCVIERQLLFPTGMNTVYCCYVLYSSSMEVTLPRSLISPGTPMNPGSSALCLKTTSCKCGRW